MSSWVGTNPVGKQINFQSILIYIEGAKKMQLLNSNISFPYALGDQSLPMIVILLHQKQGFQENAIQRKFKESLV